MARGVPNPVVHLELRTGDLACACAFYTRLFGWRADILHTSSGDYATLTPGDRIEGGVVEHEAQRANWLPYVEVTDMADLVERARLLGATALLSPREGPAGWRSVLAAPDGGVSLFGSPRHESRLGCRRGLRDESRRSAQSRDAEERRDSAYDRHRPTSARARRETVLDRVHGEKQCQASVNRTLRPS